MRSTTPRIFLLDGDYPTAVSIARELSTDLDATIVGGGTSRLSRLHRSKYCDVGVVIPEPTHEFYVAEILDQCREHHADVILPVGYRSTRRLVEDQHRIPKPVQCLLPSPQSFYVAEDKRSVSKYAREIGIDIPADFTEDVIAFDRSNRRDEALTSIPFPVFLKPQLETGGGHASTARVNRPASFWPTYDLIAENAPNGDVLVQECITGSDSTFGCGLLFVDEDIELFVTHEELRSVPRHGGSGTHLRICRDPKLEAQSIRLLQSIGWDGVALVEYKRRADGTAVLMEVNPKFWASYALASRFGYRFASTLVASLLDIDTRPSGRTPSPVGEMVFPLRELYYYLSNHEDESIVTCLETLSRPAPWDVDTNDILPWITPPIGLIRRLPGVS